jgi:hypothetical protein
MLSNESATLSVPYFFVFDFVCGANCEGLSEALVRPGVGLLLRTPRVGGG